ncbi:MAG: hypothetical protein VX764_07610 [Planctomycetota bacterium]|nr:hypothetical protein [Planctomycetota bacterium]
MLSLSTSLISLPSDLSFEERVRRILDGDIPGLVLGQELGRREIPSWVQEARGAGHSITALEVPSSNSETTGSSNPSSFPDLFATDESERQLAAGSCLEAISCAQQHEISIVIVSNRSSESCQQNRQQNMVLEQFQARKNRISGDPEDPENARWLQKLQQQQQSELNQLWRANAPHPKRQQQKQDALLRTLDAVLEEATRRQVRIGLRETADLEGLPHRSDYQQIAREFEGAPLGLVADPAAALALSRLTGKESSDPVPDPQQLIGVVLRDCLGARTDQVVGTGDLDLELEFGQLAADLLRILEAPGETGADEIQLLGQFCRDRGIDGDPPPEPGEPFPIIGAK